MKCLTQYLLGIQWTIIIQSVSRFQIFQKLVFLILYTFLNLFDMFLFSHIISCVFGGKLGEAEQENIHTI